jgi:hypothetical protein
MTTQPTNNIMDKSKKEAALAELEQITKRSEALRAIIDEQDQLPRDPQCNDLWSDKTVGWDYLIVNTGHGKKVAYEIEHEGFYQSPNKCPFGEDKADFTYKGKFHEVYVKRDEFIEDVKAALDHKDIGGASFLGWINDCTAFPDKFTVERTRKLLEKLNIL